MKEDNLTTSTHSLTEFPLDLREGSPDQRSANSLLSRVILRKGETPLLHVVQIDRY